MKLRLIGFLPPAGPVLNLPKPYAWKAIQYSFAASAPHGIAPRVKMPPLYWTAGRHYTKDIGFQFGQCFHFPGHAPVFFSNN